jgi:hypothetical protein
VASEVLQELDLTQRSLREDLLAEHICDLFDRYSLASLPIGSCTSVTSAGLRGSLHGSLPDDAICALSQLFCDGISLVNNEVLIEHFKYFAPSEVSHLGCRLQGTSIMEQRRYRSQVGNIVVRGKSRRELRRYGGAQSSRIYDGLEMDLAKKQGRIQDLSLRLRDRVAWC